MRKTIKLIALAISVIFVLGMLIGCSANDAPTTSTKKDVGAEKGNYYLQDKGNQGVFPSRFSFDGYGNGEYTFNGGKVSFHYTVDGNGHITVDRNYQYSKNGVSSPVLSSNVADLSGTLNGDNYTLDINGFLYTK